MATNFEVRLLPELYDLGRFQVVRRRLCDQSSGERFPLRKACKVLILHGLRTLNSFPTLVLQACYVHLSGQLNAA